jgi:arylsulfatase A-like enzyme
LVAAVPSLVVISVAAASSRRPSPVLASAIASTALLPAAFLLARFIYKRIPWDASDLALAALGTLALAGVFFVAVRWLSSALGDERAVARLARVAWPLLLLPLPALLRVVPAAWAELAPPAAIGPGRVAPLDASARPNLLLLSIDTMRFDRFGATGDPHTRTPHLDRLARSSVHFPVCVAPSPWTLPSLGTLLTGVHPGEHLLLQELTALADSAPSLPEICHEAGWSTGAVVSNPWLATGSLARGFDTFDVAERIECLAETSPTRISRAVTKALLRSRRLDSGVSISRRGLAWIARRANEPKPWFVWLHYFDPHLPNWPAPPLDRLDGPPPRHVSASILVEEIRANAFEGGEAGRREIVRLYDAEVVATDRAIGTVIRALERAALLERTLVVVTADHGEELWDHGGYGHGHSMFEEVVRVPLFLRTGRDARIDPRPARLVDVAPTLVGALGLTPPSSARRFAGIDLLARSAGSADSARTLSEADTAYGEATLYGPEKKFLRTNRWKIVVEIPDSTSGTDPATLAGLTQLYDLATDPGERRDVARTIPEAADSARVRLGDWARRVGAARTATASSLPDDLDPAIREQLEALGYAH